MSRIHLVGLTAAIMLCPADAGGQIPDTFTNLQVLPKAIPRDSLIGIMRSLSFALGVRCQYCHVGGDGISFEGVRFPDDDDIHKRKARYMLRMVATLNEELLAGVPERSNPAVRVQCVTCHGGLAKPTTLEATLGETIRTAGADSAVAQYRRLRERYYGSAAYDFTVQRLMELALILSRDNRNDDAVRMLELDAEFFPQNASVQRQLGETHVARADTAAAIVAFERVMQLQPQNAEVRRRLEQLRK
jgi:hypothetical protein